MKKKIGPGQINQGVEFTFWIGAANEHGSTYANLIVKLLLESREWRFENTFGFVGQVGFDVLLKPSEEKGAQNFVQTTNNQQLLLFVQFNAFTGVCKRSVEPFVKRTNAIKHTRKHKIQQRP